MVVLIRLHLLIRTWFPRWDRLEVMRMPVVKLRFQGNPRCPIHHKNSTTLCSVCVCVYIHYASMLIIQHWIHICAHDNLIHSHSIYSGMYVNDTGKCSESSVAPVCEGTRWYDTWYTPVPYWPRSFHSSTSFCIWDTCTLQSTSSFLDKVSILHLWAEPEIEEQNTQLDESLPFLIKDERSVGELVTWFITRLPCGTCNSSIFTCCVAERVPRR